MGRIVIGLLGMLFGGIFLYAGAWMAAKGHRAERWPKVVGKIVERSTSYSSGTRAGSGSYRPEITYSYTAGGKIYSSKNVGLVGFTYKKREEAQRAADELPAEVTVAYDPSFPADGLLDPSTPWKTIVFCFLVGLLLFSLGAWGVAASRRSDSPTVRSVVDERTPR